VSRPPSLRAAAAAGARWTFVSMAMTIIAQLGQLAILARILDPRDFGLAASAMVVIGLATRVGDAGINNAIIAKQTNDNNVLSSLYWANVLVGVAISLLLVASIPVATAYFDEPGLAGLILLAVPASLIAPVGQQFQMLLQKELHFKPLASVETAAAMSGAITAVLLALAGAGAASLIGGYLVQQTVRALWLAIRGWNTAKPSFRLRRSDLKGYLSFGMYQLGERTTNYLGSNLDYTLIGGMLGASALGVYSIAYRLISIPQMRLNPIITRVAFPVFARRQDDDEALCRGYLEVTRLVAFISFPMMAGFAVTAPQLVPVAFGPQWSDSIPILQVLSIVGVMFSLGNLNGSLFMAKNRPDLGLKLNVGRLVLLLCALIPAIQLGGILAVAWAFVGVVTITGFFTRWLLTRLIDMKPLAYFKAIRQPLVATLAMIAVVLLATPGLKSVFASDAGVLFAQAGIGAAVYAACTVLLARTWALETWRLVVRGRSGAQPQRV
jgi:lipopolysaccharide exporter